MKNSNMWNIQNENDLENMEETIRRPTNSSNKNSNINNSSSANNASSKNDNASNNRTSVSKKSLERPKDYITNENNSLNFLVHQYFIRNEFDTCIEILSKYSKSNSGYESPYSILIKGLIKRGGGEVNDSLSLFKQSYSQLKNTTDSLYILKEIGKTFLLMGKYPFAVDIYNSALHKNPNDWDCLYHLGLCYMNLRKFHEAENYLQKALDNYECEEILIVYGKVYLKQNNLDRAISIFEKALELSPQNTNLKSTLGTLYMKKNQTSRALTYFTESIEINKRYSNSLMGIASIYQYQNNFIESLKQYRIGLSLNPGSALVWNNLGLCFLAKNKKIIAATCLRKALLLSPFEWIIAFNLGLIYLMSEQYVSAYVFMNTASTIKKDYYLIFMYLGIILTELNEGGNAISFFNKALSLKEDPVVLFNFIISLLKNGKLSDAKEKFNQFNNIYGKNKRNSEEYQTIEQQLPMIRKVLGN